ncbi:MAG: DUF2867 domain-containing protein [Reichenbachiella sp.]
MSTIQLTPIPDQSLIKGSYDYEDAYRVKVTNAPHYSVDFLTYLFFTTVPVWVSMLLHLRNFLVRVFGLRTDFPRTTDVDTSVVYQVGDRVAFEVTDRSESEIVMAEDDIHLFFKTSVYIEKLADDECYMYSITVVKYNNLLGKLYFTIVKPFHKIIIKYLLLKTQHSVQRKH